MLTPDSKIAIALIYPAFMERRHPPTTAALYSMSFVVVNLIPFGDAAAAVDDDDGASVLNGG